ncbi:uridine phosphorylase [Acetobacterium bakii]|uniref:Uridine phosphorylase n=2 Tax=Acetobacterium bakii TaxID=52689 RepID=A0A0L6U0N9_9FIRM|nr:uridine phosphorylase [Acetobacterium bakii]KNZ41897.1 uridine phosphorylase [Acetobacterium bakii]
MNTSEKMYHIQCQESDIGHYVLLPGDPGRVSEIAKRLEHAKRVASNREYTTYTGYLDGVKVSVTSTGIGGPSAAIALEELIKLGAHTFIRVGTCGGIDCSLEPGSLIIATGAIRKEGTTSEYIPIEFPAVGNFELLTALNNAAHKLSHQSYLGIVESKDSFYGQHEPDQMPNAAILKQKWEAWKAGGALASEMETSALYIISAIRRVRCGSILLLIRNREKENLENTPPTMCDTNAHLLDTAVEGMRQIIRIDKEAQ